MLARLAVDKVSFLGLPLRLSLNAVGQLKVSERNEMNDAFRYVLILRFEFDWTVPRRAIREREKVNKAQERESNISTLECSNTMLLKEVLGDVFLPLDVGSTWCDSRNEQQLTLAFQSHTFFFFAPFHPTDGCACVAFFLV